MIWTAWTRNDEEASEAAAADAEDPEDAALCGSGVESLVEEALLALLLLAVAGLVVMMVGGAAAALLTAVVRDGMTATRTPSEGLKSEFFVSSGDDDDQDHLVFGEQLENAAAAVGGPLHNDADKQGGQSGLDRVTLIKMTTLITSLT